MPVSGRIILKPRRARPFFARHPWVFDTSIQRIEGDPPAGAEVVVVSSEDKFVARGLYNPSSTIRVRLYRWDDGPLDETFWAGRLESAIRLAARSYSRVGGRVGLPARVQRVRRPLRPDRGSLRPAGWSPSSPAGPCIERRDLILRVLAERTSAEGIVARTEKGIALARDCPRAKSMVVGEVPDGPVEIVEHGLRYRVDLRTGQKTGFYLDQRDNRPAVASYCRGRPGSGSLLLHGGVLAQCAAARRGGRSPRSGQLGAGDRAGPRTGHDQWARSVRGLRWRCPAGPRTAPGGGSAVRGRDLRPAEVRAAGQGRRARAQGATCG